MRFSKLEQLEKLKDLILENSYTLKNIGVEGRNELKEKILSDIRAREKSYICATNINEILETFKSINRSKDYIDTLPIVIKKAIEIYCSGNYEDVNNGFLRKNNGLKRGTQETLSSIEDYATFEESDYFKEGVVDGLDFVINQTKLDKNIVLYRGCNIKQFNQLKITSPEELLLMVGKSFIEYGYTSTSGVLDGRSIDESPIIMVINVPPGVHFANFIDTDLALSEGEILLEREVEYTINKVEIINDQIFVYTDIKSLDKKIADLEEIKLAPDNQKIKLARNKYGEEYGNYGFSDLEEDYLSGYNKH